MRYILLALVLASSAHAQNAAFDEDVRLELAYGVLVLKAEPFDAADHDVVNCRGLEDLSAKRPCLIDGMPVFGTDPPFGLPATRLVRAALVLEDRVVELDVSGMYNPWKHVPDSSAFAVGGHWRGEYVVSGAFSDAGGAYVAEWIVTGAHGTRTILSDEEYIMFPFLQQLDANK